MQMITYENTVLNADSVVSIKNYRQSICIRTSEQIGNHNNPENRYTMTFEDEETAKEAFEALKKVLSCGKNFDKESFEKAREREIAAKEKNLELDFDIHGYSER